MAKRLTPEIKERIYYLRRRGFSLNEIKAKIPVGYGTIFRYIQGVQILPKYRKWWFGKRGGSRKRKKIAEYEAEKRAHKLIKVLSVKERTIFHCALYWAEGGKRDFNFTNTDPEMIKIFVDGLENIFGIPKSNFRVSIRIYEDLDKQKCLTYWAKIVGIAPENFVNIDVLKGKKSGKLAYGMCRVRIRKGGNMLKYMAALRKRMIETYLSP